MTLEDVTNIEQEAGKLAGKPQETVTSVANVSDQPASSRITQADFEEYYKHFLPFKSIYAWLNHSPLPNLKFGHREFAMEHFNTQYQRYCCFTSSNEFKDAIVKASPSRFEVGAIYNENLKNKIKGQKSANLKPVEKELNFDIDLTDYDDIRTCCAKTDICLKCWKFINLAVNIMDVTLREDFGFENLIWVFSGRRGVHCWVSDPRARVLDESKRRSIIEYVMLKSGKNGSDKLSLRKPYHPLVERALKMCTKSFQEIIMEDQDPWRDDEKAITHLAKTFPDSKLKDALTSKWKAQPGRSSLQKWKDVDELIEKGQYVSSRTIAGLNQDWKREIILSCLYPKLDIEVSRQLNHLLKSPFCIHPKTGNVCVPFDPKDGDFDPLSGPTLQKLFEERSEGRESCLKPYVEIFDRFVQGLNKEELAKRKTENKENLDF
ncbi:unnamed protein product [Kuraishia capsulata CBS 1993]|uniref:DNA primase n=1 Tax=Kuraishia capsulata CBS 1993 TaxID=1382522 RepID=W6MIY5_9ASCO|nr:uncharacterized protein KUCA_T00002117001 [Kuraishia capsulata CBS 1993]CDK26146.1 unnamed protein product [Kuraishia capsulata CBS 1993]